MESDDDYQLFSRKESPSPPQSKKLKRLKKALRVSNTPLADPFHDSLSEPAVIGKSNSETLGFSETAVLEKLDEYVSVDSSEAVVLEKLDESCSNAGVQGYSGLKAADLRETLAFEDSGEISRLNSGSEGFDSEGGLNLARSDELLSFISGSKGLSVENGSNLEESDDPVVPVQESEDFNGEGGLRAAIDGLNVDESGLERERSLELEGNGITREDVANVKKGKSLKKRRNSDGLTENTEKKKKIKSTGDDTKRKESASMKKREEKERKATLERLHADTQRLLRETRDAAFKPQPVIQKPISSVLEKIRRRKLEMSKKTIILNNMDLDIGATDLPKEVRVDVDLENVPIDEQAYKPAEVMRDEATAQILDVLTSLDASCKDNFVESVTQRTHETVPSQEVSNVEPKQGFRAPLDDTQDIFCDSQTSDEQDVLPSDQPSSPLEEVLVPSLLAMNLKFDSAPPDEGSSDEEDNDKENIDPRPHRSNNVSESPDGNPVKAFLDDEAVEEDSDNELFHLQDNGEEEDEDNEELKDLIATNYKEKPIDKERRNELHQMWLEQQDEAGTENLLQRLNCGSKQREPTFLDEEVEVEDDEEEGDDFSEAGDDLAPSNIARINSRKAKQLIPQMFTDKDDAFLSSDDEETEKKLVKQRLLEKAEEHVTFLSPKEDEGSREVFGLIKKLNIAADAKKKAKTTSFFDTMLTGGNSNSSSSKSSFLGRASNHALPSSRKQGSSKVRGFIFGQDDSNSRSALVTPEESSDAIQNGNQPTKNSYAKYSSSQSKPSSQNTKKAAKTGSSTSLFEILRRSSVQSNACTRDTLVGQTQTVFAAFQSSKKSIKLERRA